MRLYGYWRSSASWRVRIGLLLKGVAWEYVPVHLVREGGENKHPEHRARNPMGQLPVLEVPVPEGGTAYLSQSLAILTWLDATHPYPPLLPAEPLARARVWQLAEVVNSGIQPYQNLPLLGRLKGWGHDELAFAREHNLDGLTALEAMAERTAGRFLVGDAVSIADICLVPQLYSARRFGVDLDPMPTLRRVEAACLALPAFVDSHPDRQPDAG